VLKKEEKRNQSSAQRGSGEKGKGSAKIKKIALLLKKRTERANRCVTGVGHSPGREKGSYTSRRGKSCSTKRYKKEKSTLGVEPRRMQKKRKNSVGKGGEEEVVQKRGKEEGRKRLAVRLMG